MKVKIYNKYINKTVILETNMNLQQGLDEL